MNEHIYDKMKSLSKEKLSIKNFTYVFSKFMITSKIKTETKRE